MRYLTQEELETVQVGTLIWIIIHDVIHFNASLKAVERCDGQNLGTVILNVDTVDFTAMLRRDVPNSGKRAVALCETITSGLWTFIKHSSAEKPSKLLFSSREDIRLVLRENGPVEISDSIRRLKRQLHQAKQKISKKEAVLVEFA